MATSGCGNRLAGGNQFFQGPKGARAVLATPGILPVPRFLWLSEARRPSLTWHHRSPRLPPAISPQGLPRVGLPPPSESPTPQLRIDAPITRPAGPPPGAAGNLPPARVLSRAPLPGCKNGEWMLNFREESCSDPHTHSPRRPGDRGRNSLHSDPSDGNSG